MEMLSLSGTVKSVSFICSGVLFSRGLDESETGNVDMVNVPAKHESSSPDCLQHACLYVFLVFRKHTDF